MQVSVESPTSLERRVTVTVESARIDDAMSSKFQNLSKTVSLKGFRSGKVPMKVIKQNYGPQVRNEVIQEVIQSTFYEAINQEKLRPAGYPSFEPKNSESGDSFEYTATFEVYPDVELADLNGVSIEKPVAVIAESDIDDMVETIRKQNVTWEDVERAAQQEDKVSIDFVGSIDGVAFDGGTGTDMEVEIGKGQLIKGFEEGLVGLKAGDESTLSLKFPDDYQKEDLQSKDAEFAVTVKKVTAPVLPEVNEDLAKKLGIEVDGDMDKFRAEIKENMQRELDNTLKTNVKKAVMDKLLDLNKVDVPQSLIDEEAKALAQQMAGNLMQQGMPADKAQLDSSVFNDEAQRRVSLGLIMAEIVKQQSIEADEEAIRARIDEIAEPYEHSAEVVSWYYADEKRKQEVASIVIEEKIVNWVHSQAKVDDKSMTFKEIMQPQGAA